MKNLANQKTVFIIFFLFSSLYMQAQDIDTALSKLNTVYKQEKLYLHFDRPVYNAGETIWFKAYLFADDYPSEISKTLYTELTDANGKVLQRITAPVFMSSAAGSLEIPADVNTPVFVRSYTAWMLNFDSSFIYTRPVNVIPLKKPSVKGSVITKTNTDPVSSSSVVLQFFPEGGDLVQGVASRVAFKATDRYGVPVDIAMDILTLKGKKISRVASVHDGMGTFMLLPEIKEQYKAVWTDGQGQIHESLLPVPKQKGFVLEVNRLTDVIEFKIRRSPDTAVYPFVYVVAQMNQQLLYKAKAAIGQTVISSGRIPTENFPSGIIQVTVFSPHMEPLAERIVFSNLTNYFFITDLNSVVKDMGKRKKNTIQVDVPDTLRCNLSVTVIDADRNPEDQEENIFSRLLLTSDIKGYVHKPLYYFSSEADSVAKHLDLVMMTNGWRRFRWEQVLAGRFPSIRYLPDDYLSIEGQVQGVNKTVIANKEINGIVELKNKNTQYFNTPVLPDGRFLISGLVFFDTAKFYYQFNNDKNRRLTYRTGFNIRTNFLKEPLRLQLPAVYRPVTNVSDTALLVKNKELYLEQLSAQELQKVKTLQTVVVKSNKKSVKDLIDEEYASGFFSGGNSRIIIPEEEPSFLSYRNVLDYLRFRSAGLQISPGLNEITWRGSRTALFLNEMPTEASLLESISMSDIAMVKIFSPPFFGASGGGGGGAIAIYLKKGAYSYQSAKGLDFVTLHGYSPVKEFYSPDYSRPDPFTSVDYRNTLYWNPFVITDKNNRRIFLSFYNNDVTKRMRIIIEGCNEEGKLTRIEKLLQ